MRCCSETYRTRYALCFRLSLHSRLCLCLRIVWRTTGKDLITCMEKAREDRLAYEYLQKLRNRWTSLEVTLTTLLDRPEARAYDVGIGDIAFMPEIREVVDAPDDEFMDESSFAEVHENFGEMVERWKVNATKQLRELVMQSRPRPQGSRKAKAKCAEVDVLKLATTRFHCIICDDRSAALYYPGVLSHSCLRCNCRPKEDDPYKRFVYGKLKEVGGSIAILRHLDRLEVAEVSDAATSVIQLCGKDPKVATVKKMNALGIMLVQGGIIRTWRNAVCLLIVSSVSSLIPYTSDTRRRYPRHHERVAFGDPRRSCSGEDTSAEHKGTEVPLLLRSV